MLLHSAHARLQFANENAVADRRRVLLYDRPAQSDDLLAQLLPYEDHIPPDIGPKRIEFGI